MTAVDNDTRRKGVEGPFEYWEGDHTALVHVLWAAKHDGLTLEKDFDAIASMVLSSRFLAARTAQAIEVHDRAKAAAALREAVDKEIADAERYERNAEQAQSELEEQTAGAAHPERLEGLRLRVKSHERFAADARARATRLLEAAR